MSNTAINQRKQACGYTPAPHQPRRHCPAPRGLRLHPGDPAHRQLQGLCARMHYEVRDPDTSYERQVMECTLHRMPVSHHSICEDWARKQ